MGNHTLATQGGSKPHLGYPQCSYIGYKPFLLFKKWGGVCDLKSMKFLIGFLTKKLMRFGSNWKSAKRIIHGIIKHGYFERFMG